ncbi:MAG: fatty acid desaturase [Sedimentitalea sp.]|uniref:fatty acid desaturase n=1 Tax=Sedimentitalea sp. TaxID=2048915 RepID=UPI003266E204
MDHIALLRSLSSDDKADLTRRTNAAGIRHLAIYVALLALCSAGIVFRVPFWPVLMVPQGILLVFLFTLSHECTHQTPFRSKWLNEIVGHAIAPLIALPFVWFRYFHLAHHKFTNDPLRDPELAQGPRPRTRRMWLIYLSGWGYWYAMVRTLWTNAFGQITADYLPPRRHRAMLREARIILTLYLLATLSLIQSSLILWLWLLPVLLGQPVLRLYLLAEHGLCPPVADMLENSRTTFTNRVVRFLAWNMPYHAEHHTFPSVPFHQLPALHQFTREHLRSTSDGYAEFTRDYVQVLDH